MKRLIFAILLILNSYSFSQIKDLGGVDYTTVFNSKESPDFSRSRIWFNYPIKLKKGGSFIVNGLKYSNIKLDFSKDANTNYSFDLDQLEQFHILEYTIGYSFLLNEKWRFLIQASPVLSSNLKDKISGKDFTFSGGVLFMRTLKEPKESKLTLGLMYNQRVGIPLPLPVIAYNKKVDEHFRYTIGVPVNKIKYYFNKEHSVETFIRLDGYYANLSNNLVINNELAENISMSGIISGIGYDNYIGKRFNLFIKGGYTLRNSLRLVQNTNNKVFKFDTPNAFLFRVGFKFNF